MRGVGFGVLVFRGLGFRALGFEVLGCWFCSLGLRVWSLRVSPGSHLQDPPWQPARGHGNDPKQ